MVRLLFSDKTSPKDFGFIEWRFDWRDTGLTLKSVLVIFRHKVFEDAAVDWHVIMNTKVMKGGPREYLFFLAYKKKTWKCFLKFQSFRGKCKAI